MADPTGTIGKGAPPDDLSLIYQGGGSFMARMDALAKASDRHEQALAQLRLGQEAAAAFKDATTQRSSAETDRKAAAAELVKARQDAANIRADAERERAAAQELRRAVEEQLRTAQEKEQLASKAESDARAAGAKAALSQRAAEQTKKQFNDKIERLQSALRSM